MINGLTIEIIGSDEDLVKVRVHAGNDKFAGTIETYIAHDDLRHLAGGIRGFPISAADRREFALGQWTGKAHLTFRCTDGLGHAVVDIRLQDNRFQDRQQTVNLILSVEAAAIDIFVDALSDIRDEEGHRSASLPWLPGALHE
jgi:hypothetical protein